MTIFMYGLRGDGVGERAATVEWEWFGGQGARVDPCHHEDRPAGGIRPGPAQDSVLLFCVALVLGAEAVESLALRLIDKVLDREA
jgi:hypothetical protein